MEKLVWSVIFILCVLFSIETEAQIASIDSLEVELKLAKEDTARLRIYIDLIDLYDKLAPSEKAMQTLLNLSLKHITHTTRRTPNK
jgi:hypothetical protein